MEFGLFLTPLLLFILGIIIFTGKANFLIAGYNTSSEDKKEKVDGKSLSKFVGKLLFLIAFIQLLVPIFIFFEFASTTSSVISATFLTSILAIIAVVYMNTGDRFIKK